MNIFIDYDYYANQLWIATRFLESCTLLIAFILINRKEILNTYIIFIVYFIVSVIIILSIFYWKIFPICFVEGEGLTRFKVISEYIISLILIAALWVSFYFRSYFNKLVYRYVALSIIFTIFSELAFTFYISNYGVSNMIGHFFKIVSFYLVYKAIIEKCVKEPQNSIFLELQSKANTDGLTGLYNHRYLYEKLEDEIRRTHRTDQPFSIIIFDVDHFKRINDEFGHVKGDDVLLGIAQTIKTMTRVTDIVGRYGGEEFMVILPETDIKNCYTIAEKIRKHIGLNDYCNDGTKITISGGIAQFDHSYVSDQAQSISMLASKLVNTADSNLYRAKSCGRDMIKGLE